MRLTSLTFAVGLLALLVFVMLTGAIPAQGADSTVVFRSPAVLTLFALLWLSLVACTGRRGLSWRRLGFALTHAGVALALVGCLVDYLWGRAGHLQVPVDEQQTTRQFQLRDGRAGDLGFNLTVARFQVRRYPPDLALYRPAPGAAQYALDRHVRLPPPGGRVDLGACGSYTVAEVLERADLRDVTLAGPRQLVLRPGRPDEERLAVERTPQEVPLAAGPLRLTILRAFNNLPHMAEGEAFVEAAVPVRPGLVLKAEQDGSTAFYSLEAGGQPVPMAMGGDSPRMALPEMAYDVPPVAGFEVAERGEGPPCSAVRLAADERPGAGFALAEGCAQTEQYRFGNDWILQLLAPSDRSYRADLRITDRLGRTTTADLAVNHPVACQGWRLFLDSYDRQALRYVNLTVRRDPGRACVLLGLGVLTVGIAWLFYAPEGSARE